MEINRGILAKMDMPDIYGISPQGQSTTPSDAEIIPENWLYPKLRNTSPLKCIQLSGSLPDNWLCEMSRKLKDDSSTPDKEMSVPENLFRDKFIFKQFAGIGGSGLLK